jgi:hypothetical protein
MDKAVTTYCLPLNHGALSHPKVPIYPDTTPIVAGSKPRQALLFEVVSEYVSLVARVDSRTQESQRRRNGLSWFGPIGDLCLATDDSSTQGHPKLGGYNRVYKRKREIWQGDGSVRILRSPHRQWSLP